MAELKPCPFCGGQVEFESAGETHSPIHGLRQWWGIVCRNTANLGGTCAVQIAPQASKEAAAERWNRRATPPSPSTAEVDERAAFEAWASGRVTNLIQGKFGTGYVYADAARAWEAWQARAALASRPAVEAESCRRCQSRARW